jgi:hypothetical protein
MRHLNVASEAPDGLSRPLRRCSHDAKVAPQPIQIAALFAVPECNFLNQIVS